MSADKGPAARSVIPFLILSVLLFQAGGGISGAVVPVRLASDGYSATAAGLVSVCFHIGFLIGGFAGPSVIARAGARNTLILFSALAAVASLGLFSWQTPVFWALMRLFLGLATGIYFTLIEAWLAERSLASNRGAVFSAYMVVNRFTVAFAQGMIAWFDTHGLFIFAVSAAFLLIAPWPAAAWHATAPSVAGKAQGGIAAVARGAPAAAAGSLVHGLGTVALSSLLPVHAIQSGLGASGSAAILIAVQAGAVVVQGIFGALSDWMDRRLVIIIASVATAASAAAAFLLPGLPWSLALANYAVLGGFAFVLYSLAAAHANDIARPEERLNWSSGMLLLWGIGAMGGPVTASWLMDFFGSAALFAHTALLYTGLALFILWRLTRRGPPERKPGEVPPGQLPG